MNCADKISSANRRGEWFMWTVCSARRVECSLKVTYVHSSQNVTAELPPPPPPVDSTFKEGVVQIWEKTGRRRGNQSLPLIICCY